MDETQVVGGLALTVQVGTAIYALRLNRLFGSHRAGWSLFGAFALMAAVHVIEGSNSVGGSDVRDQRLSQLVYLLSSGLLLIGLAHVGMVFRQQLQIEQVIRANRDALEGRVQERTAELAEANAILRAEIHDRQRAEAEKLHCITRLAGGVAHDFNNILTLIQGHAGMALTQDALPESVRESLGEVQSAGERAAQLTRQLQAVARGQTIQRQVLDLNYRIRKTLDKMRQSLGGAIGVQLELSPTPVVAKADPAMVDQMLASLIVNAREAMPNGGQLRLATRTVKLDAHSDQEGSFPDGLYAWLTIADTGRGIDPEMLPHVFEPFGATQEVGLGSGLGLATIQGVVHQHRGRIEVSSAPGQGTTFEIYLPACSEAVPKPAPTRRDAPVGNRTVLLVEDDASLRKLGCRMLSRAGFNVLEADSAVTALEVWEKQREEVDLLFTDIIMPQGMNGLELAQRLTADRPMLKVLCTSGYVPDGIQGDLCIRLLAKPYDIRQLLDAVETVLTDT
jgi:signal transduction histidine kinase